jgi:hypothetical protein
VDPFGSVLSIEHPRPYVVKCLICRISHRNCHDCDRVAGVKSPQIFSVPSTD